MPSKYKEKKAKKIEKDSLSFFKPKKIGCISLKKQYETELEAEKAIILSGKNDTLKLSVYFCIECHKWHWTTNTKGNAIKKVNKL